MLVTEWSLDSSVFQALTFTKFLFWIYSQPYGITSSLFVFSILDIFTTGLGTLSMSCEEFGYMLTQQQLCRNAFLTKSDTSMQTDPHYLMLASINIFSTFPSDVGVISSTYSQHALVAVNTTISDRSRSLQLHVWRVSGMPYV